MAKVVVVLGLSLAALAGCQQQGGMVARWPDPSFDPPAVQHQDPPPVAVQPRAVTPPPPRRPSTPSFTVPREWVAPVASRPWQWIVVHHSATPTGGAVAFDRMHKNNGWDELGYHFVIGNGTGSADGLVEVGSRWLKQKWGAHTRTPDQRYNNFGIGICLVGNFENTRPTPAQMQSLARLTAYLMKTYRIPADRILGHRDCKPTECPGHNVILADVRRLSLGALAELSGVGPLRTASTDLPRLPTNR